MMGYVIKHKSIWILAILVAISLSFTVQGQDDTADSSAESVESPDQLISRTAGRVLDMLNTQRAYYQDHPHELSHVVENEVMPHFDVNYSARLILGRYGRDASDEQLTDFANALAGMLVRRYAESALEFVSTDQLEVLPLSGKNTDRLTRVKSRVKLENGAVAPVDYAFRKVDGEWKVFDITIEGISYVSTYRNQIGPMVKADGLDSVIRQLNNDELELEE